MVLSGPDALTSNTKELAEYFSSFEQNNTLIMFSRSLLKWHFHTREFGQFLTSTSMMEAAVSLQAVNDAKIQL